MPKLTQAKARTASIIEFTHVDGSTHGGVVMAGRDGFSVVSHPRYGDTKARRFLYADVEDYRVIEERHPVHLPTFARLTSNI